MSISTMHTHHLRDALTDMTGAVDVVEAVFTPWDADQEIELEVLLAGLDSLDRLDREVLRAS